MNLKIKEKLQIFSRDVKEDIYASYLVYKNPKTPLLPKIIIVLIIGYFLSPIDLIPDFIPILGYLDDLVIIPLGLLIVKNMIPEEVWAEAKKQAGVDMPKLKYLKYIFTGIIIIFWLLVVYFLYKLFLKFY